MSVAAPMEMTVEGRWEAAPFSHDAGGEHRLPTSLPKAWQMLQSQERRFAEQQKELDRVKQELQLQKEVKDVQAHHAVRALEQEVASLKRQLERGGSLLESQKVNRDQLLERETAKVLELQKQRQTLMEAEANARRQLKETESAALATKRALEEEVSSLKRHIVSVTSDSDDVRNSWQTKLMETESSLRSARAQASLLHVELQAAQDQIAYMNGLSERLKATAQARDQLEFELSDARAEIARMGQHVSDSDNRRLISSMQAELSRLAEIERQNVHAQQQIAALRSERGNVEMLKEQLASAKGRATRGDATMRELEIARAEIDRLRAEQHRWNSYMKDVPDYHTPEDVGRAMIAHQQEKALLMEQVGQARAEAARFETVIRRLEEELSNVRTEVVGLHEARKRDDERIRRDERLIKELRKQRDSQRGIIESYEADAAPGSLQGNRVKDLEESLESQMKEIELLRAELSTRPSASKSSTGILSDSGVSLAMDVEGVPATVPAAQHELLQRENARLIKRMEALETECAKYESRLGTGAFNAEKVKVLHMSHNPEKRAVELTQKRVAELEEENRALVERIQALQGGSHVLPASVAKLEREVEEKDKKIKSLEVNASHKTKAFHKMTQDFREAVYALTGYQINAKNDGQYHLRSVFAERESDYLMFKCENGVFALMETEFTASLKAEVDLYLGRLHSIPAFLAHITTELFSKQTYHG